MSKLARFRHTINQLKRPFVEKLITKEMPTNLEKFISDST